MTEGTEDRIRKLRHDLSNPLAAILAEAQLQLLNTETLPDDVVSSFRAIESLSRRMRDMLQAAV